MKQAHVIIQNSTISDLNLTGVSAPIIVDGGSIAVANSTFFHNTAPISGGIAASAMQAVTLDSCTFINSYGTTASALLVNGSSSSCSSGTADCSLTITNSVFSNNTNTAVLLVTDSAHFQMHNSTFSGNSAAQHGGGGGLVINVGDGGADSSVTTPLQAVITSSTFINNTAFNGGALVVQSQASSKSYICTFSNLTVVNNSATRRGGAFLLQQVNLDLRDSLFSLNTADPNASSSAGGAISMYAICARSTYTSSQSLAEPFACSVSVSNTTFDSNNAGDIGGALFMKLDGYAVSVRKSRFTSNAISVVGGAGAALDLIPVTLGAGLSRMLVLSESNFTGNTAPISSLGSVTIQQVACIAIQNCIFDSNAAGVGAAIFTTQVNSDETTCWQQALGLSTLPRPLATASGQLQPALGHLENAAALFDPLSPEPAPADPTAAEPFSPVVLDIRGSSFFNNSAIDQTGGAMALGSVINAAAIVNCSFTGNAAASSSGSGGAITIFSNNLFTIAGTSFTGNTAPSSQGIVFHFSQPLGDVSLAVLDSNFTDNVGTAISGDNSYILVNSSRFVNNSAGATGAGAILVKSLNRLVMNDCLLANNTSLDSGGAVQTVSQNDAAVVLDRITAYGNRAPTGGFLVVDVAQGWQSCYVAITNSNLQANEATSPLAGASFAELQGSGGAIWTNSPLLWIHNSSLTGNYAATIGGAADSEYQVYSYRVDEALPTISDSVVRVAQLKNHSSLVISNTQLMANEATGAGGAVYATSATGLVLLCNMQITPDMVTQVTAYLNTSDSLSTDVSICDSWIEGQNYSPRYGSVLALPAKQVRVSCAASTGNETQYSCSSSPDAFTANITDFWSTSQLDSSGVALSRLVLEVGVQDDLGQTVTKGWPTGDPPQLQAQGPADNPTIIFGQTSAPVDPSGRVDYQDLLLRAPQGTYSVCFAALNSQQSVDSACVPVSVRGCRPGEVMGPEMNVCDPCAAGTYSFDNISCQSICPDNARCLGAIVLPYEGYWQSAANATLIHQCPNQGSCKGSRPAMQECAFAWYGTTSPDQQALLPCQLWDDASSSNTMLESAIRSSYVGLQCTEGYTGRLCTTCQLGYGSSGQFQCRKCDSKAVCAAKYFLLLVALILCNACGVWVYLPEDVGSWAKPEGSDYFEGLLTYLQLASILSLLDVQWPSILQNLFKGFSWLVHIAPKVTLLYPSMLFLCRCLPV
ncbi:hypothetical protein ABBQ32_013292 [Trebouxia sp. C0010 RCD-2024]